MQIVIYGKQACQSCTQAKLLCEVKEVDFVYKQLDKDYTITEMYEIAPRSHKTFPMITLNGMYLGGLKDLQEVIG